jgi:hypothetical protein
MCIILCILVTDNLVFVAFAMQDVMSQLPACKLASPDAGLFASVVKEHQSLDFFDFVPFTATQLHPQLRSQL